MKFIKIIFINFVFIFVVTCNLSSQSYKLTGTIKDIKNGRQLSFATLKIADTTFGTSADQNGDYILKLKSGSFKIIASYIGYFTDTINIFLEDKNTERDIYLKPTEILTEEIEVLGEDPAYDIIRKAIKYKKEFKKKLNEYDYDAYSKFVIRSNIGSEKPKGNKDNEESNLGIFGILESETKGYFKKPDLEKQIVISKRETANITRGFAIPLIVNFYDEDIEIGEIKIPGPVSDDAFDNYEYKLTGTTSIDSTTVFKIKVTNSSNLKPQFKGIVYIIDSSFSLIKIDLNTNEAGNPRGIDDLRFIQKFSSYQDNLKTNFWMPNDVQIYAEGSFAGLIKFKGEAFSIISNYNLNTKAPKGIFDEFVVKVLTEASKKDSVYWINNQLIKNSTEEKKAFIDIAKKEKERGNKINFGLTTINFGKYLSEDFLTLYSFNRVSGHQLALNLKYNKDFGKISLGSFTAYSFADKKFNYDFYSRLRFLSDNSLSAYARVFNKLNPLFFNSNLSLLSIDNTFYSLFYKRDKSNYYYGNGYELSLTKSIIPQFRLTLNYFQDKQTSAKKNTEFSFAKDRGDFPENLPINDAFTRTIGFGIRLDPNKYSAIDWGDGDISRFRTTEFPTIKFKYDYSNKNTLLSTYDFRRYEFNIYGRHNINSYFKIKYRLGGVYLNGKVPYQSLGFFSTYYSDIPENLAFFVTDYNEYLGDKVFYLNFENNFGKILWGNIPVFKKFDLVGFFNAGITDITNSNLIFTNGKPFSTTDGIYSEAGFGIDKILEIFRIDFAWRLNKFKDGKNFFFVFRFNIN